MKTKKIIAAALAASLAAAAVAPTSAFAAPAPIVSGSTFGHGPTWVPFAIMGCAGAIILAALVANARDRRELTAPEAWSCGILFWFSPPRAPLRAMHRYRY